MNPTTLPLLVTGGSGFLGGVVAEVARAGGWAVTATRFSTQRTSLRPLDVRDAAAVEAVMADVRPAAVVHTAYVREGPASRAVIVDGSAHVAASAARHGARLVHLSTDIVFGGTAGRPYTEDDPPSPITGYGRDKAEAEARVAAVAPGAVMVRTSLIYGGPSRPEAPPDRMARDPGAAHYTDELRCPVQVDDLARALLELCGGPGGPGEPGASGDRGAAAGVSGALHVAGPDALSRWEFACLLAGRRVRAATAPAGRPLDCRLDSSRARGILRTSLRGVREAMGGAGSPDRP